MSVGARSTDGFTTLETLVAFTILALVLGAASQSIGLSARSLARANQSVDAAQRALDLVALETARAARLPAPVDGETGGAGWLVQRRIVQEGGRRFVALRVTIETGGVSDTFATVLPLQTTGAR